MRSLIILITFTILSCGQALAQPALTRPAVNQAGIDPAVTKAEQLTQQIRAEQRKIDFENTGVKWMPWSQAGKATVEFITKRENGNAFILTDRNHIDIAVQDVDENGKPDILLYFWGDCGTMGCMYKVYLDNESKDPRSFFGTELVPYKKGIMLDHGFFTF